MIYEYVLILDHGIYIKGYSGDVESDPYLLPLDDANLLEMWNAPVEIKNGDFRSFVNFLRNNEVREIIEKLLQIKLNDFVKEAALKPSNNDIIEIEVINHVDLSNYEDCSELFEITSRYNSNGYDKDRKEPFSLWLTPWNNILDAKLSIAKNTHGMKSEWERCEEHDIEIEVIGKDEKVVIGKTNKEIKSHSEISFKIDSITFG